MQAVVGECKCDETSCCGVVCSAGGCGEGVLKVVRHVVVKGSEGGMGVG